MEIALLNARITIQKNAVVTDGIGNHMNRWTDYYTCHATVSGEGGKEALSAGQTLAEETADFTIRYCGKAKEITSTGYRVLMGGEHYDIVAVDHQNYKRRSLKLRCRKGGH